MTGKIKSELPSITSTPRLLNSKLSFSKQGRPTIYLLRLSVYPSVCMKPKFHQLFCLFCLNLRCLSSGRATKKVTSAPRSTSSDAHVSDVKGEIFVNIHFSLRNVLVFSIIIYIQFTVQRHVSVYERYSNLNALLIKSYAYNV